MRSREVTKDAETQVTPEHGVFPLHSLPHVCFLSSIRYATALEEMFRSWVKTKKPTGIDMAYLQETPVYKQLMDYDRDEEKVREFKLNVKTRREAARKSAKPTA